MKINRNSPPTPQISMMKAGFRSQVQMTLVRPATLAAWMLVAGCLVVVPVARGDDVRGERIGRLTNSPVASVTVRGETNPVPVAAVGARPKDVPVTSAGFDRLAAFKIEVSDEMMLGIGSGRPSESAIARQIPEAIKALDEKRVCVTGFMLPTKVSEGGASEFLLLKNQSMCCFGTPPALNEYVIVRSPGKGAKVIMDDMISVSGRLLVGEIRQNHFLAGIYLLEAEKVEPASSSVGGNR